MNLSKSLLTLAMPSILALSGCGTTSDKTAGSQSANPAAPTATTPTAAAPASAPDAQPSTAASQQPVATQQPAVTPAPEPAKPPEPKKYVIAAGTPIAVRTVSGVSTKTNQSGTTFEATLSSPIVVDGHTLAKTGSTVTGTVEEADQGGRVKGKASLTLALSRLHLANGQTVSIRTNSIVQEAKSGTKKNLARTGIASGAGAAIGAIAGGGKGAAIGAGIGAGAGVAANVATRGPAAEIPSETPLRFTLSSSITVTEKR